ncbi:MAG: ATP synthase F0 subunit B [Proteobacteria bacterium]|nr:ATP synthase F0 subunit B [Pseudomonadota bacterium]
MQKPVLSTLAAGSEHPLIDIDGTMFLQFGLFLIMAVLATQWLFKPYLRMREERRAGIEGARDDAENLAAEAGARKAEYDSRMAAARARAHAEQRTIRSEATAYQREVTDKARSEANQTLASARAKIRKEAEAARAELLPRADNLARDIASKLLSRKVA